MRRNVLHLIALAVGVVMALGAIGWFGTHLAATVAAASAAEVDPMALLVADGGAVALLVVQALLLAAGIVVSWLGYRRFSDDRAVAAAQFSVHNPGAAGNQIGQIGSY